MIQRLYRHSGPVALVLSLLALLASTTGLAGAAVKMAFAPGALVRLGANKKVPAKAIGTVKRAQSANKLDGKTADDLTGSCAPTSVDLGTFCLDASLFSIPDADVGKNDWFYATQACVNEGGYLPSAAMLIGAAARVKLAGTIDDSPLTASTDIDPSDGLKDRREMSATLVTTAAGSSAAGSEGVSDGSKGDPKSGEPDPTPFPADPEPETLQYVTVYDNGDKGGAAGSKPVTQPENFRCAFNKLEGASSEANG